FALTQLHAADPCSTFDFDVADCSVRVCTADVIRQFQFGQVFWLSMMLALVVHHVVDSGTLYLVVTAHVGGHTGLINLCWKDGCHAHDSRLGQHDNALTLSAGEALCLTMT